MRQRKQVRGFTLAEMLVVMALLGLVALLGAVKLGQRNNDTAVSGLAQELFARLAEARFLSISSGCQVQVTLDPTNADRDGLIAEVQLATQPGMAPQALAFQPASDAVTRRRDALIGAIAVGTDLGGPPPRGPAGADALVFFPDGTMRLRSSPPNQLGATLYLRDPQGRHPYRVAIFGRTAFARVLSR